MAQDEVGGDETTSNHIAEGTNASAASITPAGLTTHTESSSSIYVPADDATGPKTVFLNPAQEYNRDISICAIRCWSEVFAREDAERKERARQRKAERPRKKRKIDVAGTEQAGQAASADGSGGPEASTEPSLADDGAEAPSTIPIINADSMDVEAAEPDDVVVAPPKRTFTCFEALAASGLRSIRYAKEIPLLRWVVANDLSPSAVTSIRQHIDLNGLTAEEGKEGKVRPNQGDCTDVMYAHRHASKRFDVVDLDPYGTAAPFLDAAVQAVADGGLLCVTCTDMAVLAGGQYPEKAFSNYGGIPIKGEFTHEAALRLVLSAISSSAVRYGRCMVPLLSLSIDFYVRVFVRIYDSPVGAKKASTLTGVTYSCHGCHAIHTQPLARATDPGNNNVVYKMQSGPPCDSRCDQCGGTFAVGGPIWLGPLHDRSFVADMVRHVNSSDAHYGTVARLRGMLAVAESELDVPFYFTPSKVAALFHCTAPSLQAFGSALLRAGFNISRSHAAAGSIKTNAPWSVVLDIMRAWIASHPVKMENIKEGNPARALLAKQPTLTDASFSPHADFDKKMLLDIKLPRYEEQPAGRGPMALAKGGKGGKRRRN